MATFLRRSVVFGFWFRAGRRKQLLSEPVTDQWRDVLSRNVAVYRLLPSGEQQKLLKAARIIAAERQIVGCKGLVVTDEMRITIAAQAALLLLGEEGYYFDRVPSILLYPSGYVRPHRFGERNAVVEEIELLGESWQRGSIVLSWPAVLFGGRDPADGQNLVLHEFAHHLDGLDGEMGGTPPLPSRDAQRRWRAVFDNELARLADDLAGGRPTLLDPYGSTNEAELLAVATECFFERPGPLREQHSGLYGCLRDFYKVDPTEWFSAVNSPSAGDKTLAALRPPLPGEEDFADEDEEPASATELPPLETSDACFRRGCENYDLGRFDLAASDFDRCVRMSPDDEEAVLWRGRAYFFGERVEAALADAQRACRLDPDDKEAACLRAMCLSALGRYAAALDDFDRASDSFTDDIHLLFYRGVARAGCERWMDAIGDFSRVIFLDPHDAEAHYERALCYDRQGLIEFAERDLAKARELGIQDESPE